MTKAAASEEHFFDEQGFDLWGYNRQGHYDTRHDRAPFQNSPFPHCEHCDKTNCPSYPGTSTTTGKQEVTELALTSGRTCATQGRGHAPKPK
jgi:hypothetical protein